MKLEDCKPGVRVRVYDGQRTITAKINEVLVGGLIDVTPLVGKMDSFFHHKQLRKLVKRKRPEITIAYSAYQKDIIYALRHEPTKEDITHWKTNNNEIWVMRGVKRL